MDLERFRQGMERGEIADRCKSNDAGVSPTLLPPHADSRMVSDVLVGGGGGGVVYPLVKNTDVCIFGLLYGERAGFGGLGIDGGGEILFQVSSSLGEREGGELGADWVWVWVWGDRICARLAEWEFSRPVEKRVDADPSRVSSIAHSPPRTIAHSPPRK